MRTSHYIELVGLPGSGKTEAAKILLAELQTKRIGVQMRNPLNANLYVKTYIVLKMLWLLCKHPSLIRLWLSPIADEYTKTPHIRSVVRNMRYRLIAESVIVSYKMRKKDTIFINDEGIFGRVVALLTLLQINYEYAERLLSILLPQETQIIQIVTSPENALKRERARHIELPFFNDMEDSVKSMFFVGGAQQYQQLLARLSDCPVPNISYVNNNGGRRILVENVRQFVKTLNF